MPTLGAAVLCGAAVCALAVDHWLGEPPSRWHPVVWIGNYLSAAGNWLQRQVRSEDTAQTPDTPDWRAFTCGAAAWVAGALVVAAVGALLQSLLLQLPWAVAAIALGLLLKPLLAWRMLKTEVCAVEAALGLSLAAGRERLRWLVSRDVKNLSAVQVRESAIETLAENFNDSVLAPLFWFALLGLPGVAVYRFANTADAMWGYPGIYQGRNWAWAGKWAARADDVLSWLPARLTAGVLLLAGGKSAWQAASQLPAQARQTPSPNSGWPMAAMALLLDIALRKPGVYVLHPQGGEARVADMQRAIRVADRALLVFGLVACALVFTLGPGLAAVARALWPGAAA